MLRRQQLSELSSEIGLETKVRIIVVDDHPLLRQALCYTLGRQPDFEIVAEASDGEEAVKLASEVVPDIIIMDISMPKINGIEATRQIKTTHPHIGILILTVYEDSEHIINILEAGANGYLIKTASDKEVITAIRALIVGETVLNPEVCEQILNYSSQFNRKTVRRDMSNILTRRETEILKLLAQGMSNKEISLNTNLSLRTIKGYLANLFAELNVESRLEAVIKGLQEGIITTNDLKQKD
jgi:DNA-binding NarL/FixJ family response regulator